jgi:hypothetical protein
MPLPLPTSVKLHVPCHLVTLAQHSPQFVDCAPPLPVQAAINMATAKILTYVRDIVIPPKNSLGQLLNRGGRNGYTPSGSRFQLFVASL